jgi:hypothetical protein
MGLPWYQLLLSTEGCPARCRICGKTAHTNASVSFVASGLSYPLFLGSLAVALFYWDWWPLIAFCGLAVAYPICLLLLPPTATNHVSAKRARRMEAIGLAVVLLSIVAAAIFGK